MTQFCKFSLRLQEMDESFLRIVILKRVCKRVQVRRAFIQYHSSFPSKNSIYSNKVCLCLLRVNDMPGSQITTIILVVKEGLKSQLTVSSYPFREQRKGLFLPEFQRRQRAFMAGLTVSVCKALQTHGLFHHVKMFMDLHGNE